MKLLYMGVHSYKNEKNWRTENFVSSAFTNSGVEIVKVDYRKILKESDHNNLKKIVLEKITNCDAIFLQRGEGISASLFDQIDIPIIFWSTEPINRNKDVDNLLMHGTFCWVYFHTYSCYDRMKSEFPHLANKSSVLHNALAKEKIQLNKKDRKYFAIFNRNLSIRRRYWLFINRTLVKAIKGRYGDAYYADLNDSQIAINIHYSSKSLDDFETGIFEAIASGCVVISEKMRDRVLEDLNLKEAIIQVDSAQKMKEKLRYFKNNPEQLNKYRIESEKAIHLNTWDYRMGKVICKIGALLTEKTPKSIAPESSPIR